MLSAYRLIRPIILAALGLLTYSINGIAESHDKGKQASLSITETDPLPICNPSSCDITFYRAGNLILIPATADTIRGNFILDTGAPGLVLNVTYFRGYPTSATPEHGGITGTFKGDGATSIRNFSFGTFKYRSVKADLVDLGHIEDSKKIKVLGLLGVNLFKHFEMIIDYKKNVIHLRYVAKKERGVPINELLKDTSAYHVIPIDIKENKVIAQAHVGDKSLNFILDTGAESNVLDSRLPDKVFENVSINKRVKLVGSGSQKVDALFGDLSNLHMQNIVLDSLPVLITNLEQMCLSYNYCIDGMLGFDFLSLHIVGFDFVKHEMYIWKAKN